MAAAARERGRTTIVSHHDFARTPPLDALERIVDGCRAATELYGRVFKPTVHREIYAFEDLPRAVHEMHLNTQTGIPIVRVAWASVAN